MVKEGHDLRTTRQWALQRIHETRVAGRGTRHDRADNLKAIERFAAGVPHYTFGIKSLRESSADDALDAIATMTGCSHDIAYREGAGYISPQQTLQGLELATKAILDVARRHGRFIVGTGHPGALLQFYIDLVRLIRLWGGEIITVGRGEPVPPNFDLDYVEGVAVITDRASLWHTHEPAAMERILKIDSAIDLAVVDHGFAGGAINAGLPTITVMDTNDPAPAVAKRQGANVIIIPMDDNRPPSAYMPIVDTIRDLAKLHGAPVPKVEEAVRPEIALRFSDAERLVRERVDGIEAISQMIDNFANAYRDQFLQTRLHGQGQGPTEKDAYAVLASYGVLRKAFDQYIIGEIRYRHPALSPEEIAWYFRRYSAIDPCRDQSAATTDGRRPESGRLKPAS